LDADFTRPALLRVDLREGFALTDTSSTGPPLLVERRAKFCSASPSPLTPAVAAPTLRSTLCARTFSAWVAGC